MLHLATPLCRYLGYNKGNTDLSEQDLLDCTAGARQQGARCSLHVTSAAVGPGAHQSTCLAAAIGPLVWGVLCANLLAPVAAAYPGGITAAAGD